MDTEWIEGLEDGGAIIRLDELQYELPPERIAQHPCAPRDAAKLMVLHRRDRRIEHRVFRDLPEYLSAADVLVLNTTRVLPARFFARRSTGGVVEGLFVHDEGDGRWRVLLTGAGRLRAGEKLALEGGPWTLLFQRHVARGECEVLVQPPESPVRVLATVGVMPVPPYIHRASNRGKDDAADRDDYQTIYANEAGAVAAPTAGLHFTDNLLEQVRGMGAGVARVVLHVGLGTFQPVEVEDLRNHRMHREWYELDEENAALIDERRRAGGRIVAVGTTAVRVLETCSRDGMLQNGSGWTDILIYPPYQFAATDALVTNFHLPGSTLLALVCAFAGRDFIFRAYHTAIERGYRFYSYGDAMLIQ